MVRQKNIPWSENLAAWFQLGNFIPHYKRALFIPISLLGAGLIAFDLVLSTLSTFEPLVFGANVVMLAALVAAAFLLWRRVPRQGLALLGLFLVACFYIVTLMICRTEQALDANNHSSLLQAMSPWLLWFVLLDIGCFFAFCALTALRLTLLMAGITLSGALYVIFQTRSLTPLMAHDMLALAAANALVILFVYQMTRAQERSSQTDFLTGLPNRMRGYDALEYELQRAARYQTLFTVVLFDIDHFKKVNDRHGHSAGDAVLREFTAFVQQHIRRTDVFARWGGEEFILILPESDLASGRLKADYLRVQIKNRAFYNAIRISSSFGVTTFYPRDTSATLLERADAALYRAKANGRNCVETE